MASNLARNERDPCPRTDLIYSGGEDKALEKKGFLITRIRSYSSSTRNILVPTAGSSYVPVQQYQAAPAFLHICIAITPFRH